MELKGEFICLVEGELVTYHDFNDIPMEVQHVISFMPTFIPPPHTEEEHEINAMWMSRLHNVMSRETN